VKTTALLFAVLLPVSALAGPVRGYTKRNGTHVSASHRTNPDHTQSNNYSAKGHINPYNGKVGTKRVKR